MTATAESAWALLARVPDPELPNVSIVDLGIARDVRLEGGRLVVTITPTYSGCPAMREIEAELRRQLSVEFDQVEVRTVLTPPWTSDWISELGRAQLSAAGIAPPGTRLLPLLAGDDFGRPDACPHCGSAAVEELAAFGSAGCRALWRCTICREPFDYFKAH